MKVWQNTSPISLPGEKWREIPNTNADYYVSNFGRIKSIDYWGKHTPGILKQRQVRGADSYLKIDLDKYKSRIYVHRLVGKLFIPNPENKPFINHKDGDKQNNHYSNLEWCTRSENTIHSFRVLGTKYVAHRKGLFGEHHNAARPIIQFSMDGVIIRKWGSIIDACRALNLKHSAIVRCCRHRRKSSKGFKWEYQ